MEVLSLVEGGNSGFAQICSPVGEQIKVCSPSLSPTLFSFFFLFFLSVQSTMLLAKNISSQVFNALAWHEKTTRTTNKGRVSARVAKMRSGGWGKGGMEEGALGRLQKEGSLCGCGCGK